MESASYRSYTHGKRERNIMNEETKRELLWESCLNGTHVILAGGLWFPQRGWQGRHEERGMKLAQFETAQLGRIFPPTTCHVTRPPQ